MRSPEHRQFQRITPADPIPARVMGLQAFIINLSLSGVRVAHRDPPLEDGLIATVSFEGIYSTVDLETQIIWSHLHQSRKHLDLRDIYHSGARILSADERSGRGLRETIQHHIELALDEQKANARGLPPIAVRAFKTGGGSDFIRCEYVKGRWEQQKTTDPCQPANGFTVASSTPAEDITLLCATFERSDEEGRDLIHAMAEISISKAEGTPTRRYTP